MGNDESTTSSKYGGTAKTQKASAVARDAQGRLKLRMVQNVHLIWLDDKIDGKNVDCKNTIAQLRCSVNRINTFTDGDQCIQFLNGIEDEHICMIISGSLGQHIVPRVHDISQVDSIFIFCGNKKYHEQWAKDWPKIKGVYTDIKPICEVLKQAAQRCEHNAVSISFMATSGGSDNVNLNRLDPSFMYMQILKETLLTIKFEPKHIKEYIAYCRKQFHDNDEELKNITKMDREYHHKTPIWWYTYECFLYRMLNRALRTMDVDVIVRMGFYIKDLHNHIDQLHSEQFKGQDVGETFTVYRGQRLSKTDFDQLMKTQGSLMTFNNFLLTSKDRDICLNNFAQNNLTDLNMMGILFVIKVDPSLPVTPFASISNVSAIEGKDEVLFSIQSVFRIQGIKQMGENNRLYQVHLNLVSDIDKDLCLLTDRIRDEIPSKGWYGLGELLRRMGQFDKAEEVYQVLLDQTIDENDKVNFYHQLALAKDDRGEYQEAIKLYEQALEIKRKTLPANHLNLVVLYKNISAAYYNMGDYPKALSYYETILAIQQQSRPPNHSALISSYNNIGNVYNNMGDYPKALSNSEKALTIQQKSLASNHPGLAYSYDNIGLVYYNMGDYPKALSSYEKALAIRQQSLSLNHSDLGSSYNNIGIVYESMKDYLNARSYYERAVKNGEQSLLPTDRTLQQRKKNLEDTTKKL